MISPLIQFLNGDNKTISKNLEQQFESGLITKHKPKCPHILNLANILEAEMKAKLLLPLYINITISNDFCNTDQYWYYGEACSSRTNVCHRSYTSREPFSPLFRVCHVNVSGRCFNFLVSVNYLFERKNVKWQRTGTITN